MKLDVFKEQFKNLCWGFDVDPKKKIDRIPAYFKSKLGKMDPLEFEKVIVRAIEELNIIKGHIPTIQQLLALRLSMTSVDNEALDELYQMKSKSPKSILENLTPSEEAALAKCHICNGTGFVIMEKDDYTYSGMTCTCEKGLMKSRTSLGKESGCYINYLNRGYRIQEAYVPKDGAQFYKRKHLAEDIEIQMAYNKYIKKQGEEPKRLEVFYMPQKEKTFV